MHEGMKIDIFNGNSAKISFFGSTDIKTRLFNVEYTKNFHEYLCDYWFLTEILISVKRVVINNKIS